MAAKKCGKCEKMVYQAEWVQGLSQYWHRNCWRCSVCQKSFAPLDLNAKQKDKVLYCKKCHEEKFGAQANVPASQANVPAAHTNVPAPRTNVSAAPTNVPSARTNILAGRTNVPAANSNVPAARTNVPAANANVPTANSEVLESSVPTVHPNNPSPDANLGTRMLSSALSSLSKLQNTHDIVAPTGEKCKVDKRVDWGHGCDECMRTIDCDKPRWTCADCPTDYCASCYKKKIFTTATEHSYTHRLIEIKQSNSSFEFTDDELRRICFNPVCSECGEFLRDALIEDCNHGIYQCFTCDGIALCYDCVRKTKLSKHPQHENKHLMSYICLPPPGRFDFAWMKQN